MKSLSVLMALAVLAGSLGSQSTPTLQRRLYVESGLDWKGKPWTGSGGLRASSYIEIFYPDHRYISAGVILGKETEAQETPYIIENEGFSLRAGTWSEDGSALSAHSKYVHLDAGVSPYPPPVDERFDTGSPGWTKHGGPLHLQTTVFTEVRGIRGIEHLEKVAIADSCNLESKPSDLGNAWATFCQQQAFPKAHADGAGPQ